MEKNRGWERKTHPAPSLLWSCLRHRKINGTLVDTQIVCNVKV